MHSLKRYLEKGQEKNNVWKKCDGHVCELLNMSSDGYALIDNRLRIVEMNEVLLKICGLQKECVVGKNIVTWFKNAGIKLPEDLFNDVLKYRNTFQSFIELDSKSPRFFSLRLKPIDEGIGMILVETTESLLNERSRANMHMQLVQSARLASVGKLSAGIAHELNNPLTSVIGYGELILEDHNLANIKDKAHKIVTAGQRMKTIIDDLIQFSSEVKTQSWDLISIESPLRKVILLLDQMVRARKITIDVNIDNSIVPIFANYQQIETVFHNLIKNSIEAFDKIEDERKKVISIFLQNVHGGTKVVIEDNGDGISEEIRDKIFDPFFTTKSLGQGGMGLGLAIVFGIIEQHKGHITFSSEIRKGTRFELMFPADAARDTSGEHVLSQLSERR